MVGSIVKGGRKMLNEKEQEQVRQAIAKAQADSIIGKVEHIITDAL